MFSGPAIGLYSSPNPFSQTPAGTLKRGDNVRYTSQGVIEPRRGFDYLRGASFGSTGSLADVFAYYASTILLAYDLTKVSLYTDGEFTDFGGEYAPVGANRMRFEGAARSCFFNTTEGIFAWDGVGKSGVPIVAGNPLPLTATVTNSSANGWQSANTAVAYRYTICSKDAFGRIVEGPPSGRTTLRNQIESVYPTDGVTRAGGNTVNATTSLPHGLTTGDVVVLSPGEANFPAGPKTITVDNLVQFHYTEAGANVSMTVTQQWEITRSAVLTLPLMAGTRPLVNTNNFIKLYRSEETLTAGDTPSDEMFQCYESGYLTESDISAGFITVEDTAPESVLDVPLYTNTNADGALAARYRPPRALDMTYWANRMWFANTEQKDSLRFTLIGVGSPDGLQIGDTFIINFGESETQEYTAAAASAGTDFELVSYGDPGFNIEQTARNLITQINANPLNEFFCAYYVSSEGGLPGEILIQSFGFDSPFTLTSDRTTAWTPQLPDPVSPAWPAPASDTNRHPAGLFWSPMGIPDACPPVNYTIINSDNDDILRIFPLHYRLLIFKTDGIYTCTNVEPFSVQKLSAYRLLAPDSLHALEDCVYALTDQGVVRISDAGLEEISDPVDDVFRALDAPVVISDVAARSFGLAYRSERQSLLWCPEGNDDGTYTDDNAQAYAYSTMSQGFTRYAFGIRCGAIDPDNNVLVVAPTDDNKLWVENKTLTDADYFDLSVIAGSPSDVSDSELTLAAAVAAQVEVGDVLSSGTENDDVLVSNGDYYVVTAVADDVVTVSGEPPWTTSSDLLLFKAIECDVEFNKLTGGSPATLKMMQQATFLFRKNGVHDVVASFTTEINTAPEEVELSQTGWGEFAWGAGQYGNPTEQLRRIEPLPMPVEQCCQLSVGFSTRQAMKKFEFLGIDVALRPDSEVNDG